MRDEVRNLRAVLVSFDAQGITLGSILFIGEINIRVVWLLQSMRVCYNIELDWYLS